MKTHFRMISQLAAGLLLGLATGANAFDSGGTGADGAFNPTVDTVLQLPPDGIFNYTSMNIPAGVTVRFERNAANTPVRILVQGDATIDGVLDVSGGNSPAIGGQGDGVTADDGLPGLGGPGGFDGGAGGAPGSTSAEREAGMGLGPGAGFPSAFTGSTQGCPGTGGSFGIAGKPARGSGCSTTNDVGQPYGSETLLPLVGGSGGGGGTGGASLPGSGGGGGGGALLIAVSGTLTVNGSILADGGNAGAFVSTTGGGGSGGGGSGGGIRLIASTLTGDGSISAQGGTGVHASIEHSIGGGGGAGRIRLEAETMTRTAGTNPPFTLSQPGPVFLAGMPGLRIASVAGLTAPVAPSGSADIVLPMDQPNPVEVVVEAHNVPLGNTVTVTLTPAVGNEIEVITNALSGALENSSASAMLDIPDGPSTLLAEVSFTVPEGQSMAFNDVTGGEAVQEVRLAATGAGASQTVLVTVSGREVAFPGRADLPAVAPF